MNNSATEILISFENKHMFFKFYFDQNESVVIIFFHVETIYEIANNSQTCIISTHSCNLYSKHLYS